MSAPSVKKAVVETLVQKEPCVERPPTGWLAEDGRKRDSMQKMMTALHTSTYVLANKYTIARQSLWFAFMSCVIFGILDVYGQT